MNVAYCQKVLLATPHCGNLARLVGEMRREALSLSHASRTTGAPPAVYGRVLFKQTEAGLRVLCTVDEKDSDFRYQYSISMPEFTPGFHLTAPQGQTLVLFIGRAMGCNFDQMHVQASAASVFHVTWVIPVLQHAEWLARTSAVPIDDKTVDRMRDECYEARHRMEWKDVLTSQDVPTVEVESVRLAAEQGDAMAQNNLGNMYLNGNGVPQDYTEANMWLCLAANQGSAEAQVTLGAMYANGEGVPEDYKEAMKWFRLAAEQGNARAQNNLGSTYRRGLGVPQDYAEAAKWYRLAAEQGLANAQYTLGVMYARGDGVRQDFVEASV